MVYFMQPLEGGLVKIGFADIVSQRLAQVSRDVKRDVQVLAVIDGGRNVELSLHRRFSYLRIVREWFEPGPELLDCITREGRPWHPSHEPKLETLKVDQVVASQIKEIARLKGISINECFLEIARDPIARAYLKVLREQDFHIEP